MRRTSTFGLPEGKANALDGLLPVGRLLTGGLHFYRPAEVSHADEERHIHAEHYEVFINLQGRGIVEIEGVDYEFNVGDVLLIEPGESHHVRGDPEHPLANLWIGARIPGG